MLDLPARRAHRPTARRDRRALVAALPRGGDHAERRLRRQAHVGPLRRSGRPGPRAARPRRRRPRTRSTRCSADVALVHVTRRDKVAQAVSLWRAVQTRAWRGGRGRATQSLVYDFRGDRLPARAGRRARRRPGRAWFAANGGRAAARSTYETLIAAHEETVRARARPSRRVRRPHARPAAARGRATTAPQRWVARFEPRARGHERTADASRICARWRRRRSTSCARSPPSWSVRC